MCCQTQTLPPFRQIQPIVKQACARAGIEAELQVLSRILQHPDPSAFMRVFCAWEVAQQANPWTGQNIVRWRHNADDQRRRTAEHEMDLVTRAALCIRRHDLVVDHVVVIPIVTRAETFALAKTRQGFDVSPCSGPRWRPVYGSREAR